MSELRPALDYAVAYGRLAEVVRLYLAGLVDLEWLREQHATIERELSYD